MTRGLHRVVATLRCSSLLILLFGTLGSGCRSLRQSGPVERPERTVLEVDNRSLAEMAIYVVNGTQRTRIGTANGVSRTQLTIPAHLLFGITPLQFMADPIGSSRTAFSEQINVRPGDVVRLMIPPQ